MIIAVMKIKGCGHVGHLSVQGKCKSVSRNVGHKTHAKSLMVASSITGLQNIQWLKPCCSKEGHARHDLPMTVS